MGVSIDCANMTPTLGVTFDTSSECSESTTKGVTGTLYSTPKMPQGHSMTPQKSHNDTSISPNVSLGQCTTSYECYNDIPKSATRTLHDIL